jgi:hypothetical protein
VRADTDSDAGGDETELVVPDDAGGVYVEASMSVDPEAYRYGEAGNASKRMEAGEDG